QVAVAAGATGPDDGAVARSHNRRAGARRVIGALVLAGAAEHRMLASAGEIRGDAAELERSAQECAPQRAALLVVERRRLAVVEAERAHAAPGQRQVGADDPAEPGLSFIAH